MKISEIFKKYSHYIEKLEAKEKEFDIILSEICGVDRFSLWRSPDLDIDKEKVRLVIKAVKERFKKNPLSWVLSKHNFIDMVLFINKGVFVPRPETEELAVMALNESKRFKNPFILDYCAGSGAIGLYIAAKNKSARVFAIDRSRKAYYVMIKNALRFNLLNYMPVLSSKIDFLKLKFDIVVSNPPYVPQYMYQSLQDEVKKEPYYAVVGGKDGLDIIRYIASKLKMILKDGGVFMAEIGEYYSEKVLKIFRKNFKNVEIIKDMSGKDRFLKVI